jgi:UDP-N-acetylglucosamine:LPS N-acetylglucosamine transferase
MTTGPVLILTAGMGAGHDRVALELASRLSVIGVGADVLDVLRILPFRLGPGMRNSYVWTMRHSPALYAGIYRVFFTSPRAPSISPLTVLAAARLEEQVRRRAPAAVISTFHVAAQVAGHLRARGRLRVPSHVLITDFAAHRLWLHAGNDGYLCPTPAVADAVGAATGRPARCHAPLVHPDFRRPPGPAADVRAGLGIGPDERMVLVAGGSWGVGRVRETARVLADSGRYRPVVLCGDNRRLRRRLDRLTGCVAVGWRDDLANLMAAGYALVDNAAGLTAREAIAAGIPVVGHRPIPGHGRDGVRAMAQARLSVHAEDATALLMALDRLASPAERRRRIRDASAVFDHPPAEALVRGWL